MSWEKMRIWSVKTHSSGYKRSSDSFHFLLIPVFRLQSTATVLPISNMFLPISEYALLPNQHVVIHVTDYQKFFPSPVSHPPPFPLEDFEYRFYPRPGGSHSPAGPSSRVATYFTKGPNGELHQQQMYFDVHRLPQSGKTKVRNLAPGELTLVGMPIPVDALLRFAPQTSSGLAPPSCSTSSHSLSAHVAAPGGLSPLLLPSHMRGFESPSNSPQRSALWNPSMQSEPSSSSTSAHHGSFRGSRTRGSTSGDSTPIPQYYSANSLTSMASAGVGYGSRHGSGSATPTPTSYTHRLGQ
ncbi:hypothetical protein GYMLUDRAFT_239343 [Collybiopsis luxurians FD-317 M1]|nr:hypothetical protein GYMLUDRAFT_239343 [Collybiopsis luxurians FD-317 M1]